MKEDFIEFLDRFGCKLILTDKDQIRSQIIQIAHKQLIQKPKYALDKIKDGSQGYLQTLFPAISNIEDMVQLKKTLAKRILNILVATPTTADKSKAHGLSEPKIMSHCRSCFVSSEELKPCVLIKYI